MNYIIKQATINPEDESLEINVDGTVGKARLWVDGVGTNWFLLFGEFPPTHQKPVRPQDTAKFNGEINRVLNYSKKSLSDYGIGKRHFNIDIHVSQEVVNAYSS